MKIYSAILFSFGLIVFFIGLIFCLNVTVYSEIVHFNGYNSPDVLYKNQPQSYYKNSHVEFTVTTDSDKNYHFSLVFKDAKNQDKNWKWAYPEGQTDAAILKFGIPKTMFQPYYPVDSVIKKRELLLKKGMFVQKGQYLKPDLVRLVQYYRPFMEQISNAAKSESLEKTKRASIELLMKFCQDIPYAIPPKNFGNKYIGGLFPPPQVFVNKFGDCDSKAVIFCAAASYIENIEMLFLYETGHVLPAVKGIPKPYDNFYTYKNEKYIMADTAGPGRNNFGVVKDPYKKVVAVSEVKI